MSAMPGQHGGSRVRVSYGAYVSIPLVLTIAVSGMYVAPVVVAALSRNLGVSLAGAGGIVTGELLLSAAATMALANRLHRIDVQRICRAALLATFLGQSAAALDLGLAWFLATRVVVGVGSGVLYAVACYWASLHPRGVRLLGAAFVVASISYGSGLSLWPTTIESVGLAALYVPLACSCLLGLALVRQHAGVPSGVAGGSARRTSVGTRSSTLCLLITMCALGNGALQMLWAFTESAGRDNGFSAADVGMLLGASAALGVAGSLLSTLLDRRLGTSRPLTAGFLLGGVSGPLIGQSTALIGFGAGICAYGLATFFVLPYLLSAGAGLDDSGRTVTLAGATVCVAGALGPFVGGAIAEVWSLPAVGWAAAIACGGAACCAIALRRDTG